MPAIQTMPRRIRRYPKNNFNAMAKVALEFKTTNYLNDDLSVEVNKSQSWIFISFSKEVDGVEISSSLEINNKQNGFVLIYDLYENRKELEAYASENHKATLEWLSRLNGERIGINHFDLKKRLNEFKTEISALKLLEEEYLQRSEINDEDLLEEMDSRDYMKLRLGVIDHV